MRIFRSTVPLGMVLLSLDGWDGMFKEGESFRARASGSLPDSLLFPSDIGRHAKQIKTKQKPLYNQLHLRLNCVYGISEHGIVGIFPGQSRGLCWRLFNGPVSWLTGTPGLVPSSANLGPYSRLFSTGGGGIRGAEHFNYLYSECPRLNAN